MNTWVLQRNSSRALVEMGLLALIIGTYNNLTNLLPSEVHDITYVPVNLAFLGILLAWVLGKSNLSAADIGLRRDNILSSLKWGALIGILIPAPLFILVAVQDLVWRVGVDDPRIVGITLGTLLYRVLIRIPLATALFEELLFRGILYGRLITLTNFTRTALITSGVFALWHITPTLNVFRDSDAFSSDMLLGLAFVGALFSTFLGGLMFAFIRYRTDSVAGCVAAHGLINSLATVAFYIRG